MSLSVRSARVGDLPAVLDLVINMFRDLGTPDVPTSWREDVLGTLAERLKRDAAVYVTVDGEDFPISVAVGVLDHRLPSPRRPPGMIGYVEWLATRDGHRRIGAARLALEALLAWFSTQGVQTVDVHASNAARSLYVSLGFSPPTATALRRIG